ncbi:hypothetical protein VTN77DRAFT_6622 [Rasamsonia byssochlamydoides]|uniref:uncharacterized protein n=1 Tax=Rasamsonia byssochlamydoides TaxID=89139 RepID=UPI0037437F0F
MELQFSDTFVQQFTHIENLAEPDDVDLESLDDFLKVTARIGNVDDTPWREQSELVGLFTSNYRKRDRLTKWITARLGRWKNNPHFKEFVKKNQRLFPILRVEETFPNGKLKLLLDSAALSDLVAVSLVIIASSINVSSMFVLCAIDNIQVRIAVIWAFSLIFSTAMMVFTASDTINMFTATAAYLAVLVVFVGNTTT